MTKEMTREMSEEMTRIMTGVMRTRHAKSWDAPFRKL